MVVPGSKSYTHRALITASVLSGGTVINPLQSDDNLATLECLQGFETNIDQEPDKVNISPPVDGPRLTERTLNADESGTLLRFLIPIVSVLPGPESVVLKGNETLASRSHSEVIECMRMNGLEIDAAGDDGRVPITCYPGQQPGGVVRLRAETTSQHVSGWLIALSALGRGMVQLETSPVSAPYIDMTVSVLEEAGVSIERPDDRTFQIDAQSTHQLTYAVPGDYSSAAFFIAGCLIQGKQLTLKGLSPDDIQADRRILSIADNLGLTLEWQGDSEQQTGYYPDLIVHGSSNRTSMDVDAGDCPDLGPVLSVIGCFLEGESTIRNISHLANKESDRIHATCEELNRAGFDAQPFADRIEIGLRPDPQPAQPVSLSSHGDHRLAMAFSILGCARGHTTITGTQCTSKSYPEFFKDLNKVIRDKKS